MDSAMTETGPTCSPMAALIVSAPVRLYKVQYTSLRRASMIGQIRSENPGAWFANTSKLEMPTMGFAKARANP